MSKTWFKASFNAALLSVAFVLMVTAGATRLGAQDVPELPAADGSGDTPEMTIDLVSTVPGGVPGGNSQMKLSSLRGKVVMLDMFWSQCPHCEEHAPHIAQLYNTYRQRGFTVLGLATDPKDDKDSPGRVKAFMTKAKITYPVGYVTNEIIAYYADSKNHGVPQMVLFGPNGKMVLREIGWNENLSQKVKQEIEAQLAKMATVKPGSKASAKPAQNKFKQGE
ncbi:MAG: TlpA disulfide reductase family protein [Acidobacteriota bacterium]